MSVCPSGADPNGGTTTTTLPANGDGASMTLHLFRDVTGLTENQRNALAALGLEVDDFGGGTLADMGCHHMDLAFWALGLRHPTRVEAKSADPPHPETATASLRVEYQFPARGGQPPVTLTWHDGDLRPKHFEENLLPKWGDGTLFVGEKGMLLADYGGHVLLPRDQFKDYKRPEPSIPSSIGHYEAAQGYLDQARRLADQDDSERGRALEARREPVFLGAGRRRPRGGADACTRPSPSWLRPPSATSDIRRPAQIRSTSGSSSTRLTRSRGSWSTRTTRRPTCSGDWRMPSTMATAFLAGSPCCCIASVIVPRSIGRTPPIRRYVLRT